MADARSVESWFYLIEKKSVEDIEKFLNKYNEEANNINSAKWNIEISSSKGDSALIIAARRGDLSIVQYLIDKGANVNAHNLKGSSALVAASMKGWTNICKLLITNG